MRLKTVSSCGKPCGDEKVPEIDKVSNDGGGQENGRVLGKTRIFACQTIKQELLAVMERLLDAKRPEFEVEFLPYGLHRVPKVLGEELKRRLEASRDATMVILGYGLCSNGVVSLSPVPGQRLVMPRVHDCISILLGSRAAYNVEFKAEPGTIYLSRGWIEAKGDPYSEFLDYASRHGEDTARWVIGEEYKNYTRVCFIDTGLPGLEEFRAYSKKVAEFLGLRHEERKGSRTLLEKLLSFGAGDKVNDDELLVVEHPHEIEQEMFF